MFKCDYCGVEIEKGCLKYCEFTDAEYLCPTCISSCCQSVTVGLSLSFCISDIHKGLIDVEQVHKIYTGTKCETAEDWFKVIESYQKLYWAGFSEEAFAIFEKLMLADKIVQPRLEGKESHNISGGHWV